MTKKMEKADRREQILTEALAQACRVGYTSIRRESIASALGVSVGLINHQFTTMATLRRDVMRAAIARGVLPVVAQGMALRDRRALAAPEEMKARARASLAA